MSGTGRVIVGVSGSPGSLQALRVAETLARSREAALVPVIAWVPPGGDAADRGQPSVHLRLLWQEAACALLRDALAAVWGQGPVDVEVRPYVQRGEPGRVLTSIASEPDDLLVLGAGRRGALRMFRCRVSRYCAAHASCPVVLVPEPDFARDLRRLRFAWAFRRRPLTPAEVLRRGGSQAGGGPVRA